METEIIMMLHNRFSIFPKIFQARNIQTNYYPKINRTVRQSSEAQTTSTTRQMHQILYRKHKNKPTKKKQITAKLTSFSHEIGFSHVPLSYQVKKKRIQNIVDLRSDDGSPTKNVFHVWQVVGTSFFPPPSSLLHCTCAHAPLEKDDAGDETMACIPAILTVPLTLDGYECTLLIDEEHVPAPRMCSYATSSEL